MGFHLFMIEILALGLVLSTLSADAQPILPVSPTIPALVSPSAKQEQEKKLTLEGAVDLAMRNHPLIRATASGREIVDAQVSEAQAGHWPLFQFSEIFTHSNNPVFVFGSLLEQSHFGPQNFKLPQ
jgi:outer membrane protein TolC